jgi:hypothetical protein
MCEVQDGMNDGEGSNQVDQDEVVEGIIHFLQKCSDSVQPEPISNFKTVPDDDLDISGLEVPEKEE